MSKLLSLCFLSLLVSLPCLLAAENVTLTLIEFINIDACDSATLAGIKYVPYVTNNRTTRANRSYIECVGIGLGVERSCVVGAVFEPTKFGCVLDETTTPQTLVEEMQEEVVVPENSTTTQVPTTVVVEIIETTTIKPVPVVVVPLARVVSKMPMMMMMDPIVTPMSMVPMIGPKVMVNKNPFVVKFASKIRVCQNGGELDGSKCVCLADYMGPSCEFEVKAKSSASVVSELMNGTFSLEQYIATVLNETYADYGYDELVKNLVSSIWSELSLEQVYLHDFNFSSVWNNTNLARCLHRIRLYTQTDYASFEANFKLYIRSVDKLIGYLTPNATLKSDAFTYVQDWIRTNNLTAVNDTTTATPSTPSTPSTPLTPSTPTNSSEVAAVTVVGASSVGGNLCKSVMRRVWEDVNKTRVLADELYAAYLNRSKNFVADNGENTAVLFNQTLTRYTQMLSDLTLKSWNSVLNYGFWRVTRRLSGEYFVGYAKMFGVSGGVVKRSVSKRVEVDEPMFLNSKESNMDVSIRSFEDTVNRKLTAKQLRKMLLGSS